MERTLTWTLTEEGGVSRVAVSGNMTEKSGFSELVPELGKSVVLDLSGIKQVNSAGVKEWIRFIDQLKERATVLSLEKCAVPIVHQLNLWGEFRGDASVLSVLAPYFCGKCNAELTKLIDLTTGKLEFDAAPPCPSCGTAMEFDDLPEQFFSFRSD
jgi:ABC-type transporter Mla MlaB component